MPSFDSLARWEKYVPNLGTNRDEPRPFYLRIAAGLTMEEFAAVMDRVASALREQAARGPGLVAKALEGVVEMGAEPLSVRGKPVSTLADYLELAARQAAGDLLMELLSAVRRYNSVEGSTELFFRRGSGSRTGTSPAGVQTDGSPSGNETSSSRGPTPPATSASASVDGGSTEPSGAPV